MTEPGSLFDTAEMQQLIDDLWLYLLPEDGRRLLASGAHTGYVFDMCLPDRSTDILGPKLLENLKAHEFRTTEQVNRFFNFFTEDDGFDEEAKKPGGTPLFDRAFELSKPVGVTQLAHLNQIIAGSTKTVDVPVVEQLRVLRHLIESAYLVTWLMSGECGSSPGSPLDQIILRHHLRTWHHALRLVDEGRL